MPTIVPAKNFVLLKPLGAQKTKAGLYAPESQDGKPSLGTVYLVGKGTDPFYPEKMEAGDTVMFKKYMSNETPVPSLGEVLNPIPFDDLTVLIKMEVKK